MYQSRNFLFACLIALTSSLSSANSALADLYSSARWFASKTEDERYFLQGSLILLGHYRGLVDGIFGQNTFKAIVEYERKNNQKADGILTPQQEIQLHVKASAVYEFLGFTDEIDRRTGISIPVPASLFATRRPARRGTHWESSDGSIDMETLAIPQSEISFGVLFQRLSSGNRSIEYSVLKGGFFVLSGRIGMRKFYTAVVRSNGYSHGFSVSWDRSMDAVAQLVSVFIASMIEFPEVGSYDDFSSPEETPDVSSQPETSSGSGFAIGTDGIIVTNAHVVESCRQIEIAKHGKARVLAKDYEIDLAVLQLHGRSLPTAASIQRQRPALGQNVVVLGYPLSDLMGGALSVNIGIVSSLSGIGGDKSTFTLSANIQPGNSGGPILDRHGDVIGVALAMLDEKKMLEIAGTTGGNIGFAINAGTLLDFLRPFRTTIAEPKTENELSVQAIAARAEKFTHQVICRNQSHER